jgi:hypothetical protein
MLCLLTAGLGVQDTGTPEPDALTALITAGLPAGELPHTGYHLYVTQGGLIDADFETDPAAVIPAGQSSGVLVGGAYSASTRYTLVLRPVIDDAETPDISCRFEFETDSEGQWAGLRPAGVEAVVAERLSTGRVDVSWTYRTPDRVGGPEDFCVYYASGPEITVGAPQATVSYERDGVYSCTLSLVGGQTYFFGVTARSGSGVESHLSPVVGPVLADSTTPMAPPVILTTTF